MNVLLEQSLIVKETVLMLMNVSRVHVLPTLSVTTSVMVVDTAVNVRVDIKVMAIVSALNHHNIVIILNKMVRFEVESFF